MQLRQIFFFILIISFNSCANKSIAPKPCGENTLLQSAGIGAIAGTVIAKVANTNGIIGAVVGASIGGIIGYNLSSMQCKYHGETQELLTQINANIEEQNLLFQETNAFSKRMDQLYNEIETFKQYNKYNEEKKNNLYLAITKKRANLKDLNLLSRNIRQNSQQFLSELKEADFSKKDTQGIQKTLNRILINLKKVEASANYNLSQLDKFEMRLT